MTTNHVTAKTLVGMAGVLAMLASPPPSMACHPCGYGTDVKACDWTDETGDGLDDTSNLPPTQATDICRVCTLAGNQCFSNADCVALPGDTCAPKDGIITICGGAQNDGFSLLTLDATKQYRVCGAGGADTITVSHTNPFVAMQPVWIDGGDGSDTITAFHSASGNGYTIYGGTSTDTIVGSDANDTIFAAAPPWYLAGNDVIDARGGNDSITGSHRLPIFGVWVEGHNTIRGGGGNDTINGLSGRDVLRGDAGNDTITTQDNVDQDQTVWAVTGTLLCGGAGDDTLNATGPAHQCFDGGVETNGTQGNDTCNYTFAAPGSARAAGVFDVGTKQNCNTDNLPVPCGCE